MQQLVIYWAIGCVIMGASMASGLQKCPHDAPAIDLRRAEALVYVAVWPGIVTAALMTKGEHKAEGCKTP